MRSNRRLYLAIFVAALALYTLTLQGDVQPADSGEFQIAAFTLGIPHPPGYPLFTMLAWLFAQAPIASPFARMSFLSVVASAVALVFIAASVLQMAPQPTKNTHRLVAFAAVLTMLGATTFWAQATTTNIRSLTAMFSAMLIYATVRRVPSLPLFASVAGLAVAHHASLVFVVAIMGIALIGRIVPARSSLQLPRAILMFALTQLVWLYLPLRDAAGARFAPGNLTTWQGFVFHVFAQGFRGDMFAFAAPEFLWDRLSLLPTLIDFQFGTALSVAIVVASLMLIVRRKWIALSLVAACAVHLFITVTYRAPQTVEYALPAWVLMCVVLGASLTDLPKGLQHIAALVCVALAALNIAARLPSFVTLSHDTSTRAQASAILNNAAPNAQILAQWHEATPMWALQDIEGTRRDVRVSYVPPNGAEAYADTFANRIADSLKQQQPTYATSLFTPVFDAHGLCSIPQNNMRAWEFFTCPLISQRAPSSRAFDRRIEALSVNLEQDNVKRGDAIIAIVTWRALSKIEAGDSLTLRLMRTDGRLASNVDVALSADMRIGEVHSQRVTLGVPLDFERTDAPLLIGAYRNANGIVGYRTASNEEFVEVAHITIDSTPTIAPAGIQFANEMTLEKTNVWREGNRVVVELTWQALKPITHDYVISVRIEGQDVYQQNDAVPALGALPTLKWISGSRVVDRHVFVLNGAPSELKGRVVVYDSTSRLALPIVGGYDAINAPPMFLLGLANR